MRLKCTIEAICERERAARERPRGDLEPEFIQALKDRSELLLILGEAISDYLDLLDECDSLTEGVPRAIDSEALH